MKIHNSLKIVAFLATSLVLAGCAQEPATLDELLAEPILQPMKRIASDYKTEAKYGHQMDAFSGSTGVGDPIKARKAGTHTSTTKSRTPVLGISDLADTRAQGMLRIEAYAVTFGLLGLDAEPEEGAKLMLSYVKNNPKSTYTHNDLGVLYATGTGLLQNDKKAVKYWRSSVTRSSEARFNLARAYYYGRGTKADPIEAYAWMELAASCTAGGALGHDKAAAALPMMAAKLDERQMRQAHKIADRWLKKIDRSYEESFCLSGSPGHDHYNPRHSETSAG